ncbi:hypothetical protein B0H15DRAFT_142519 [Mycena belliarum]|uniref:Uncharacterized protein n=1 Tax=Mycena belliarum TaxID=1033014 RepID=A0AAD6U8M0_9AGAR|nr:hypothetical protein B0H15DRAFT_142519 [Mycena belliae]
MMLHRPPPGLAVHAISSTRRSSRPHARTCAHPSFPHRAQASPRRLPKNTTAPHFLQGSESTRRLPRTLSGSDITSGRIRFAMRARASAAEVHRACAPARPKCEARDTDANASLAAVRARFPFVRWFLKLGAHPTLQHSGISRCKRAQKPGAESPPAVGRCEQGLWGVWSLGPTRLVRHGRGTQSPRVAVRAPPRRAAQAGRGNLG